MNTESDAHVIERLTGQILPALPMSATNDQMVDLSSLSGRTVVYAYPRTAEPGVPSPDGWDEIPGAKGCTPQSCSFRDHAVEDLVLYRLHVVDSLNAHIEQFDAQFGDRRGRQLKNASLNFRTSALHLFQSALGPFPILEQHVPPERICTDL